MNRKSANNLGARTSRDDRNSGPSRIRLRLVLFVGWTMLLLGYLFFRDLELLKSSPQTASQDRRFVMAPQREVLATNGYMPTQVSRVAPLREAAPKGPFTSSQSSTVPSFVPTDHRSVAQELVARLADPDFFSGGVSVEKAEQLKRSLQRLVEQGVAAVPAIREYLDRLQDIDFASVGIAELAGYPTLRNCLLVVLRGIA